MGWLSKWQIRRAFKRIGTNCVIAGHGMDVKGHIVLGNDCIVRGNNTLRTHTGGKILIGDGCEICDYAMISANQLVEIGAGTYIGAFTVLRDSNHLFQGTEAHWRLTPLILRPIRIGAGCYIAPGCYIMPGVTIGDGAVIAPRSIVTKDVGPQELWAGAPIALQVGHRTEEGPRSTLKRHQELMTLFQPPSEGSGATRPEAL